MKHASYASPEERIFVSRQTSGETQEGGFAEYITAPSKFIYRLTDNLGFEGSALFSVQV